MAKKHSKSARRSFRLLYREECTHEFDAPGLIAHATDTFKILFESKHWQTFLLLAVVIAIFDTIFIGLISMDTFANLTSAQLFFFIISFLITWLTTTYLLRQFLVGRKLNLRDGLYNSCAPLVSSFCILALILIQCIPLALLIISYPVALSTNFLATPFYAFLYLGFAILMLLISGYCLLSSIIALAAVSAPGLYPMIALKTASKLLAGRRIKFLVRLIFLIFLVVFFGAITITPVVLISSWVQKQSFWPISVPLASFLILFIISTIFIFISAYIYLYYRRMLDYEEK